MDRGDAQEIGAPSTGVMVIRIAGIGFGYRARSVSVPCREFSGVLWGGSMAIEVIRWGKPGESCH